MTSATAHAFIDTRGRNLCDLDIGAICLGAGVIGSWSGFYGALSWVGAALVIRYLVPRGGV
jgi:hypothetical protein